MLSLKVKRLTPTAKLPTKARASDAGIDFYAAHGGYAPPGWQSKVFLGVALEIPKGYCLVLNDRSSMGLKSIGVLAGVMDEEYRGPVHAILVNHSAEGFSYEEGDKIIQGLLLPVPQVNILEVDELEPSDRQEKGFGSSGK